MSIRTIVEFNHDYCHDIRDAGPEFLRHLDLALRGGDRESWERLERFGVRRAVQAHHSDDRKAVINGREYPIG